MVDWQDKFEFPFYVLLFFTLNLDFIQICDRCLLTII